MTKVYTITIKGSKGYVHTAPVIHVSFDIAYNEAQNWLKQMKPMINEDLRIVSIIEEKY